MAFDAQEKFVSTAGNPPDTRVFPTSIQTKTFASGTALLAPLTPVAFNTSTGFWSIFTNGGSNGTGTIKGFVSLDGGGIQLVSGKEVPGNVILGGRIHLDDIPVVSASYNLAQLKAALVAGVRELGFTIEGLDTFR